LLSIFYKISTLTPNVRIPVSPFLIHLISIEQVVNIANMIPSRKKAHLGTHC